MIHQSKATAPKIALFLLSFLLLFLGSAEADVIKTFTQYDVDGLAGTPGSADTVEVSTMTGGFTVKVDSSNTSTANLYYTYAGTIQPQNIYIENLDGWNGAEIVLLYKDGDGKGKLSIINSSRHHFSSQKTPEKWTLSSNVLSKDIETNYNVASPVAVQNLIVTQLDGLNGKEMVGVGEWLGSNSVFVVRYGDNSTTGITAYNYSPGAVEEEFLIAGLDTISGYEIVGFYSSGGKRGIYIINNKLEESSANYSKLVTYSPGQGIISPHLDYEESPIRYVTKDVVITNMDGSNGKELVGLYLSTSTTVGIFRMSYGDSNANVTSGTFTPTGGIYLGVDNRLADASYIIGSVNGVNGRDVYGYYGGATLAGGFVYWDNFGSSNTYPATGSSSAIDSGGQFYNLTDSGVAIGSFTLGLIDADGDGVRDGLDACPKTAGWIDNDNDKVCQPQDQCDSNPAITTQTVCGCSTADQDGDGWLDCVDDCDSDPLKHEAGVCGCGTPDKDSDGDGTLDCQDQCPSDINKTMPKLCGCGNLEPTKDENGNGIIDAGDCIPDACPNDPNKYASPGVCGCGVPDDDADGDGTADCNDECPYDPNKTTRGVCGCFKADGDGNGNGIADCKELGQNEEVFFYHNDPYGSPLAITDAAGNRVWKAEYRPFGETYGTETTEENNRQFIGKELDDETNLSYFGARYLDSEGRFLAPDPVRAVDQASGKVNGAILADPQRLNSYAYGLNNPYRYVDPDGEYAIQSEEINELNEKAQKTVENATRNTRLITDFATAIASEGVLRVGAPGFRRNSAGQPINGKGQFLSEAGGESATTIRGRAAHDAFDDAVRNKPGWQSKPRIVDTDGNVHIPDALSPSGRPVELKPRTLSGIKQGNRQLQRYEQVTGKKGRVIFYDVD